MRVWAVYAFFLVFCCSPGGPKAPQKKIRERPGHTVNAPGRLFTPENHWGVYSHYYGMYQVYTRVCWSWGVQRLYTRILLDMLQCLCFVVLPYPLPSRWYISTHSAIFCLLCHPMFLFYFILFFCDLSFEFGLCCCGCGCYYLLLLLLLLCCCCCCCCTGMSAIAVTG